MNVLPILERELRTEARHAVNYWMRVVAATVAMVVFAIMMLDRQGSAARLGARLFGNLNTARELPFKAWVMGIAIAYSGVAGIWSEGLGSLSAAATSAWLMTIGLLFRDLARRKFALA